jgi:hypothetical protein
MDSARTRIKLTEPDLACSSCRALPRLVHYIGGQRSELSGHRPPGIYRCANCGMQMSANEGKRAIVAPEAVA